MVEESTSGCCGLLLTTYYLLLMYFLLTLVKYLLVDGLAVGYRPNGGRTGSLARILVTRGGRRENGGAIKSKHLKGNVGVCPLKTFFDMGAKGLATGRAHK